MFNVVGDADENKSLSFGLGESPRTRRRKENEYDGAAAADYNYSVMAANRSKPLTPETPSGESIISRVSGGSGETRRKSSFDQVNRNGFDSQSLASSSSTDNVPSMSPTADVMTVEEKVDVMNDESIYTVHTTMEEATPYSNDSLSHGHLILCPFPVS
jgi:hypothetical protein